MNVDVLESLGCGNRVVRLFLFPTHVYFTKYALAAPARKSESVQYKSSERCTVWQLQARKFMALPVKRCHLDSAEQVHQVLDGLRPNMRTSLGRSEIPNSCAQLLQKLKLHPV